MKRRVVVTGLGVFRRSKCLGIVWQRSMRGRSGIGKYKVDTGGVSCLDSGEAKGFWIRHLASERAEKT